MRERETKVWDPLVRVFHWALVAAFAVGWLTGEEEQWLGVHSWAGYTVLGLVLARILWGLIGTRHARFSDFVRGWGSIRGYLRDVMLMRAKRYLGHNPAGGAMIVAMLVLLLGVTVTGMALLGVEEHAGPLAGVTAGLGEAAEEALEEVHEFFVNIMLFMVVVHVAGVMLESLLHRENLVRAMFTGRKALREE